MEFRESKLIPPNEFPFPFTPYSIQKDLMKNLYETIEEKKLGIFESPTGTGKSMSLLCGSLQWLFDAEERLKEDVVMNIKELNEELEKTSTGVDWLDEHASKNKIKQKRDALQDLQKKLSDREDRLEALKTKAEKINIREKVRLKAIKETKSEEKKDEIDDWDFILDDYTSDGRLGHGSSESEGEVEEKEKYYGIKIYFCSRTHSQLSQVVQEVKKSPFRNLNVRVVSLASRQNYCINESVLNLKHLSLINERCQELHKKKKGKNTKKADDRALKRQKTTAGCPYYNQTNIDNVRLKILTEIQDVEELVQNGRDMLACPYYASRRAIEEAQLVLVPYNTILHRSTRQAYGIDLKNSIVIIDEAHNLLDTIGNIHSALITGLQLSHGYSQLVQYRDKYSERFSAISLLHLNQLIFIVNKLLRKMGGKGGVDPNTPSGNKSVTIETLAEFLLSTEIDSINFYKVLEFVTKSNVANKVQGFVAAYGPSVVIHKKEEEKGVSAFLKILASKGKQPEPVEAKAENIDSYSGNPLVHIINFLQSLTNHCLDGRIVCCRTNTVATSTLKYLLLNPAVHFEDIVKDARSVILAGGTMKPISEFTEQLFYLASGTSDRIRIFSCGHIIPESNILPIITSCGPSGKVFDFSYQQRNNRELVDEVGRLLVNVCNVVPAGVVCFFTSYEYEASVYQRLLQTKIVDKITNKKKVLREPRKSNKVDEVLKDYAAAVKTGGALLFSVVGGKLSEGLNFSDDLGRCIIIVGLPYPNLTSIELKEKMNYLDVEVGPTAGKTYYENLCMKAVNQSIGRSVRHKDDYASVLLVDQRYCRPKCVKALPEWIQKSLRKEDAFGPVMSHLGRFFSAKKKPA